MSKHYPVEGVYISGVPHVEHDDCDEAFHVESGAFTEEPPPKATKGKTKAKNPADAGSSDSSEEN